MDFHRPSEFSWARCNLAGQVHFGGPGEIWRARCILAGQVHFGRPGAFYPARCILVGRCILAGQVGFGGLGGFWRLSCAFCVCNTYHPRWDSNLCLVKVIQSMLHKYSSVLTDTESCTGPVVRSWALIPIVLRSILVSDNFFSAK